MAVMQQNNSAVGQRLRRHGFDKTCFDFSIRRFRVACSKCRAKRVRGKWQHESDCPNIPQRKSPVRGLMRGESKLMIELYPERQVKDMHVNGSVTDIGASAAKLLSLGRRHRYQLQVIYVLSDGCEFVHHITAETKPKLQREVAERLNDIKQGLIFASLWGDDDQTKPPHWHIVWRKSVRLFP